MECVCVCVCVSVSKMGIKGLMKLIGDVCPQAVEECELKTFFGRTVAVDASMSLYSFLVAVRPDASVAQFTTAAGETTSHLLGLWSRTIRWMKFGIRPVYVFDGAPPEMKRDELRRRSAVKAKAKEGEAAAREEGDAEAEAKLARRSVRVTREMNAEAQRLLAAMGVPVVVAPGEAEAQCAQLCRAGFVFAVGSEDMDTLPLGAPVLLRDMSASEAQKKPVRQLRLARVLDGLGVDMAQFVDLCILCGCDYAPQIRGVGPKRAYELIRKHGRIEAILASPDMAKYTVPEPYPFLQARALFHAPDVAADRPDMDFRDPDEDALVQFLVHEKQFDETRVRNGVEKLRACRKQAVQSRLDSFLALPAGHTTARVVAPALPTAAAAAAAAAAKLSGTLQPRAASASAAKKPAGKAAKDAAAASARAALNARMRELYSGSGGAGSAADAAAEPAPAAKPKLDLFSKWGARVSATPPLSQSQSPASSQQPAESTPENVSLEDEDESVPVEAAEALSEPAPKRRRLVVMDDGDDEEEE